MDSCSGNNYRKRLYIGSIQVGHTFGLNQWDICEQSCILGSEQTLRQKLPLNRISDHYTCLRRISLNLWSTIPTRTATWALDRRWQSAHSQSWLRRERDHLYLRLACLSSADNGGGAAYLDLYAHSEWLSCPFCRLQTVWGKREWFEGEAVAGESWVKGCPICSCARSILEVWRKWYWLWLGFPRTR